MTTTIEPRMKSPILMFPEAFRAMKALHAATEPAGLPQATRYMVHLRASQINGCSFCAQMHSREMKEAGESDERIFTVAAWREAPYFTDAERAALELTEALTRLADTPDAVPDELWERVSECYDDAQVAALLIEIASINVWNRVNVAVRQVAGSF